MIDLIRRFIRLPPPFVSHQKHALREVQRCKFRVDRHRDDGVRPYNILIRQTRPFRAKENADFLAARGELWQAILREVNEGNGLSLALPRQEVKLREENRVS